VIAKWAAVLIAAAIPNATGATVTKSDLLFSERAWEVRRVVEDGGQPFCMAQAWTGGDSLSLLAADPKLLRMQVFSDRWDFGKGRAAETFMRVDNNRPWTLGQPVLNRQSLLFDFPPTPGGVAMLTQMMAGREVALLDTKGAAIRSFPLAGSAGAVKALAACVRGLNPG
jgi:hypothetical protein